ncbi:MAG: (2Fe-2S)-binding protein [Alteromonadaceae bacterium]|nr:MAG: (2Fe-2S)-binding protein [Alteromonadaceae bacterium]
MRNNCGTLRDYWYVAGLEKDVTYKDPLTTIIMETRLVIWSKSDGTLVAMRDRCSHRNALLSRGSIKDDCIKCPYHGWTYNSSGDCVNVPSEGPDGKSFENRGVEVFHVTPRYGLIWVWMGKEEPDKQPFPMPKIKDKGWRTYYMETEFDNEVTHLCENFMDVPHTVFVHEGWFRKRKRIEVKSTVERTEDSVLVNYISNDAIGFTERVLNPKNLPMVHTDKFYMPNNTRVDYIWGNDEHGFVITSTTVPVTPTTSKVYTLISYKFGVLNHVFKLFLPWYTRSVIKQDVDIMQNQGLAFSEEAPDFKHTPADTLHIFIESLRSWKQNGEIGPKPKPRVRQVDFWI